MKTVVRLAFMLVAHPVEAVRDEQFDKGKLWVWPLCEAPMLAALVITGLVDPAEGFGRDALSVLQYVFSSAIVILGSMVLNVFKCFLCLWAGGVRCGIRESVRKLLPLLCILALLEAVATLLLFWVFLKADATVYQVCSQVQIFGQELLFAGGTALWLYEGKEKANLRRALAVGLACFLLSSAWLLLPMFY
ncbi:MAG: hypothetical protein PHY64_02800 [Eubacteriales bacterium]|nr:hypothetical protein [Eubacteriales bacterium]